jgi:hypothetical protein
MNPNLTRGLFLNLLLTSLLILSSCDSETQSTKYDANYLPSIDATKLPPENRPMTMFEDTESPAKMYDKKDRWFRANEPMQVIQRGKDSVQVSLYSPVGLKDVKVYAKLPNYSKRFLIYHFTEIPAFHRSFHQIPLVAEKNDYLLENGNAVTIDKIEGFSTGAIEFSVESSDPLFAMFKKIKSKHLVQFNDSYHINNNTVDDPKKFLPMNPVLAKEAITMIINFSYALSHPLYYDTFINFDRYKREQAALAGTPVNGATNWHGNNADVIPAYDYIAKAEIEKIYWSYLDNRTVYLAMVGGGSAWGGGALASQWESGYVTGHWTGGMSVWSHEYSHHIGFGHDSNLANSGEGGGQQEMMAQFYSYLIHINDLPFTNPDVLKTWTKKEYLNKKDYTKPVFTINPKNTFLLKYKGAGKWN